METNRFPRNCMHKINLSCKYAYVIAATEGSLRNDDGDAVDEVG